MSDLVRIASEPQTLARPTSEALLSARGEVSRNPVLQAAFVRAKAEGWSADQLVDHVVPQLLDSLESSEDNLRQAALYLADEYLQGMEGILLVSRQTGKVMVRLTEEDIWQPPPIEREDGSLAVPLPRIRPDLEGVFVQWCFDRQHEHQALAALPSEQRKTSTALAITRDGRQALSERLRSSVPDAIRQVTGSGQRFLQAFPITVQDPADPSGLSPLPRMQAVARCRTSMADLRALNHRFDLFSAQKAVLANLLVVEMARSIALCHPHPTVLPYTRLDPWVFGSDPLWVVPSDLAGMVRKTGRTVMVADTPVSVGLADNAGNLVLHPDSFRLETREVGSHWELMASIEYTAWVRWSSVSGLQVENVPLQLQVI